MKSWQAKTKSDSSADTERIGVRRYRRAGATLLLSFAVVLSLALSASAQFPSPDPVSINPKEVTLEILEGGPSSWQTITLTGDPKTWSFVRLRQLQFPGLVYLRVISPVAEDLTVPSGTRLSSDWFAFKGSVKINVLVDTSPLDAQGNTNVVFDTATGSSADQSKDAVNEYLKSNRYIINGSNTVELKISWKPAPVESRLGLQLSIVLSVLIVFLVLIVILRARAVRRREASKKKRNTLLDDLGGLPSAPRVRDGLREVDPPSYPPTKSSATATSDELPHLRRDLDQLKKEVTRIAKMISDLLGATATAGPGDKKFKQLSETQKRDHEALKLLTETQKLLHDEVNQLKQGGDGGAQPSSVLIETELGEIREQVSNLQTAMKTQQTDLSYEQKARVELIEEGAESFAALSGEIRELWNKLVESSNGNNQEQIPDSYYARMLGETLAQNIAALQDGNFEQLAQQLSERLNQFFKTEVPRGDQLHELRRHCEAVNAALNDVSAEMVKLNSKAADEARPHLQRSAVLVAEVANLQEQLQSRRLSIDTTLRIPISAYPGARQAFTDELGRGIKREIEKLSEPQKHFSAELQRLTTIDVIAVVDICDKKIAHPGARPELEAALKKLFSAAGLSPILPRQGEPFKAVEQDLIEKVRNGSGQGSGIAQVVTRGFYYEREEGKSLLRKAGVAVFR